MAFYARDYKMKHFEFLQEVTTEKNKHQIFRVNDIFPHGTHEDFQTISTQQPSLNVWSKSNVLINMSSTKFIFKRVEFLRVESWHSNIFLPMASQALVVARFLRDLNRWSQHLATQFRVVFNNLSSRLSIREGTCLFHAHHWSYTWLYIYLVHIFGEFYSLNNILD